MSNSALQINLNIATSIETGSNVLFDSIEYLSGNISYNPATGTVLILEAGRYIIHWWLATQSSSSLNGAAFAISSSQGDLIIGNSPIKTGEVYGVGIIEVAAAPVTFSLVNISTSIVYLSQQVPLKGTLVVDEDETNEVAGPTGDTGPIGPTGDTGPVAATIPFSLSKYGLYFSTDDLGYPSQIGFAGFGISGYQYILLDPGVWESGVIVFNETMQYGSSFILPYDAVLKKIYVVFATSENDTFSDGATIRPFVCIGTASSEATELAYTILQNTITYTDPLEGGITYPKHTLRWGSLIDLNISLQEGTLVAVIAGIMAENITEPQYGGFVISGGLFLE